MAFTIPDIEPQAMVAGDRLQWTKRLADFPAASWTLTYYFRSRLNAIYDFGIVAVASGNDFSVDQPPSTTAQWNPGDYSWQSFVSAAGDRKLVGSGALLITENPSDSTSPIDGRSWARRCRDNLRDVLEGKAQRDTIRYVMTAVGRSEDKFTWEDIIGAISYFEGIVLQEEAAESAARGEASGKNVFIRFRL